MPAAWPRRPRLIAGNWKMHKTGAEAATLIRELVERMHARPACAVNEPAFGGRKGFRGTGNCELPRRYPQAGASHSKFLIPLLRPC